MLPEPADRIVARFLARLDRALPAVVTGFYTAALVTHLTGLAGTPIPDEERG